MKAASGKVFSITTNNNRFVKKKLTQMLYVVFMQVQKRKFPIPKATSNNRAIKI
jgi:hypothetical protein